MLRVPSSDEDDGVHYHAIPRAGEYRQPDDALRDGCGVGVEGSDGASDEGSAHDHRDARDAVVAHTPRERYAYRHEDDALRVEADEAAEQRKQEHYDEDDEMLFSFKSLDELVDDYVYRLRLVDDCEGAARYHDEEDERRHADEPRRDCVEELIERDGVLLYVVERPRDEHLASGFVRGGLELPRRNDVGQQSAARILSIS